MRPGCDRPAAARVAFDPVALQLWLDPLARRSAPVQELCEFHVERLTVPRGWSATDRRPSPVESVPGSAALTVVDSSSDSPAPKARVSAASVSPAPVSPVRPEAAQPESGEPVAPAADPAAAVIADPAAADITEPAAAADAEPAAASAAAEVSPADDDRAEAAPELAGAAAARAVDPDSESALPDAGDVASSSKPAVADGGPPAIEKGRGRRSKRGEPSLLSRAFELTGHQESVLTRPSTEDADPADR